MTSSCSPPLISDYQFAGWNILFYGWIIAGVFAFASVILSLYLIFRHVQFYSKPKYQRYIVRILFMVPIFALHSWFSYRFFRYSVYIDTVRDCYEAFVIYSFFQLLVNYLGGDEDAEQLFKETELSIPWPFHRMKYPKDAMHVNFLKQGVLQYVIVRPLTTAIAVVLEVSGFFCQGNFSVHYGYFYTTLVNTLSVTVAMYSLLTFYFTSRHDLAKHNVLMQLLAIKFVIFMTFWQGVLFFILLQYGVIHDVQYLSADNVANAMQEFLICVEMFVASMLHLHAFPYDRLTPSSPRATVSRSFRDVLHPQDVVGEVASQFNILAGVASKRMRHSPVLVPFCHSRSAPSLNSTGLATPPATPPISSADATPREVFRSDAAACTQATKQVSTMPRSIPITPPAPLTLPHPSNVC